MAAESKEKTHSAAAEKDWMRRTIFTDRLYSRDRCVSTGDRTRVSGISFLRHNRWTTAARYHRTTPQTFRRASGFLLQRGGERERRRERERERERDRDRERKRERERKHASSEGIRFDSHLERFRVFLRLPKVHFSSPFLPFLSVRPATMPPSSSLSANTFTCMSTPAQKNGRDEEGSVVLFEATSVLYY